MFEMLLLVCYIESSLGWSQLSSFRCFSSLFSTASSHSTPPHPHLSLCCSSPLYLFLPSPLLSYGCHLLLPPLPLLYSLPFLPILRISNLIKAVPVKHSVTEEEEEALFDKYIKCELFFIAPTQIIDEECLSASSPVQTDSSWYESTSAPWTHMWSHVTPLTPETTWWVKSNIIMTNFNSRGRHFCF